MLENSFLPKKNSSPILTEIDISQSQGQPNVKKRQWFCNIFDMLPNILIHVLPFIREKRKEIESNFINYPRP